MTGARNPIRVELTRSAWKLVVRVLRGGPKRTDAEQLTQIIDTIERAGDGH